jgi:outer membrane protein
MMQRLHSFGLLMAFAAISVLFWQRNQAKIAYVDSAKILAQYKGMIDARQAFEKKATRWSANVDTLTADVQKAIRAYERQSVSGSPSERDLARQLIQSRQKQLADYQQATRETAQQEEAKSTGDVLKVVNAFLLAYGKENHYTMLFVANQTGNIAFAAEGLDMTDDVIARLNAAYGTP